MVALAISGTRSTKNKRQFNKQGKNIAANRDTTTKKNIKTNDNIQNNKKSAIKHIIGS